MAYRLEGRDIVIDGWEKGTAESPYKGIANLQNLSLAVEGEVSVNFKTVSQMNTYTTSGTLTLTNSGDTFTGITGAYEGLALTVGSSVGGLTAGVVYYVKGTNQLSLSYQGAAVAITSDTTVSFTTVNMGIPQNGCYGTETTTFQTAYFLVDNNGLAWMRPSDNSTSNWIYLSNTTTTDGSGQGVAFWKNHLFVFRADKVDVCPITITTAPVGITSSTWTFNWQTLQTASTFAGSHQALNAYNNVLYWCDGSGLGSLSQNSPSVAFAPATGSTYTFTSIALALPSYDIATCIGQLGQNILVGGMKEVVYPWSKLLISSGTDILTSYDNPIILPESTTTRIVTSNNVAYIFAGSRGRVYRTNGTNAEEFYKVPDAIHGTGKPYFKWRDAIYHRNKLFFAFSLYSNDSTQQPNAGVWSLDVSSGALIKENTLSYSLPSEGWTQMLLPKFETTATAAMITSGQPHGEGYFAGWYGGLNLGAGVVSRGVDYFSTIASSVESTPVLYTSDEANVDTDIIPVGQYLTKKTYENIEYKLSVPLVANESVKLYSRSNLSASWTLVGSTTTAGEVSDVFPVTFENIQWIQLRAILNATDYATTSFVRLRELRIR